MTLQESSTTNRLMKAFAFHKSLCKIVSWDFLVLISNLFWLSTLSISEYKLRTQQVKPARPALHILILEEIGTLCGFLMMKVSDCDSLSYCQCRHKNRATLKGPVTTVHKIYFFKNSPKCYL